MWGLTDASPGWLPRWCAKPLQLLPLCGWCQWWGYFQCCPAPTNPSDPRCFSLLPTRPFPRRPHPQEGAWNAAVSSLLSLAFSALSPRSQGASLGCSWRLGVNSRFTKNLSKFSKQRDYWYHLHFKCHFECFGKGHLKLAVQHQLYIYMGF